MNSPEPTDRRAGRGFMLVLALLAAAATPEPAAAEAYGPLREQLWQVVVMISVLLFGAGICVSLVWRRQRFRFCRDRAELTESLRTSAVRYRRLFEASEITERKRAEAALGELSLRLSRSEDKERRRIARELHDSTGQKLAALSMTVGLLQDATVNPGGKTDKMFADCLAMIEQCAQELPGAIAQLFPGRFGGPEEERP